MIFIDTDDYILNDIIQGKLRDMSFHWACVLYLYSLT